MTQQQFIKLLLSPFSWLYGLATTIRNYAYDIGIFKSRKPPIFTICVGNLTVGGTGKTPTIEHLVSLLSKKNQIAILSRGYGRKTKGFYLADHNSTTQDIGDEPIQYFQKYKSDVKVVVCEKRVVGALEIVSRFPNIDLLLLDDAFQHRAIRSDLQIMLNDFNRPFYNDMPFPAGRLRENRMGSKRADAVIVTKCPNNLSEQRKKDEIKQIKKYTNPEIPIFFSSIQYGQLHGYDGRLAKINKIIIVAGIAAPQPFIAYLQANFSVLDVIIFEDHHNYTQDDFHKLIKNLKNDTFVVTTEKDMVKLKPLAMEFGKLEQFAYLPIKMEIQGEEISFDQWILQSTPK